MKAALQGLRLRPRGTPPLYHSKARAARGLAFGNAQKRGGGLFSLAKGEGRPKADEAYGQSGVGYGNPWPRRAAAAGKKRFTKRKNMI